MIYNVISDYRTIGNWNAVEYYKWITPFDNRDDAEKYKKIIEQNSVCINVRIEEFKGNAE